MRAQHIALVGALVVALALGVTTAGAGTAATTGQGLDLSTTEAIDAYLVSIGIDPASVVRQSGLLNYAGPSCPGPDWNCTTATTVVQVSQVGGQNAFVCEPEEDRVVPPTEEPGVCAIAQTGEVNRAECRLESDEQPAAQKCIIGQEGERNFATVRMLIDQDTGPEQDALQNADVDQTATEKNELHVYQTVKQKITTGATQEQEAHQVAFVNQTATGTVGNYSHVHQVQDQDLSGAATLQQQNADMVPDPLFECAIVKAANPNQCANIDQDADSGMNNSHLHQTIAERATSSDESSVTQGRFDGGNEARVHQENGPDGKNVNKARGTVAQRVFLPEGSPFPDQDTDPGCCGVGSQIGGENNGGNNVEDINLSTTQSSKPEGFQFAQSQGSSNTPGRCSITLHGRNNSDAEAFTASEPGPCFLVVMMTCESSPPDDLTVLQATGECTTEDITDFDLSGLSPIFTPLTTTPTFGLPIEMPDFGEPSDFLAP